MLRYVTISKFSAESGYTENAIRSKIRDRIWVEGDVWVKAPDGRILIDVIGFERWVATGPVLQVHRTRVRGKIATAQQSEASPAPLGPPTRRRGRA